MFLGKTDRIIIKPRIMNSSAIWVWYKMLPIERKRIIERRYRLHVFTCLKDNVLWNVQPFVIFVDEYKENPILFDETLL